VSIPPRVHASRRLCQVADILVVLCGLGTIWLLIGGAYRGVWSGVTLSVGWEHALFGALAIAAVRHVAAPAPSIVTSLRDWWSYAGARSALTDALLAFWTTRPVVLLIGFFAVVTIGVSPEASTPIVPREALATLPARFDAGWYAGIAADGYEWQHRFDRQQNLAFFPAYPVLMRTVAAATGALRTGIPPERRILRLVWIGVAISLAAFFWAAWYFSRIAHEILVAPQASTAVLLIAAYPFAVFFSAAYTESLFLLAAVGAWYHFRRQAWPSAAAWGFLAGLTRPNGCFLSLPLGLLALGLPDARDESRDGPRRPPTLKALTAAAMPGVGMLAFTAYLYHFTGVWFAWSRMHEAWGRVLGARIPGASGSSSTAGAGLLQWAAANPYDTLNALGLVFAITLIWPVWRRLGLAWAVFVAANIVPPLAAGGLLSMGRLTSTLFPLFLALAARLTPRAAAACVAAFAILQGLAAALFFTGRQLF
jgi:hypothetical protein